MEMEKAKKVMAMYGKHATVIEYEYRGKRYFVEYANNWTYCTTPARIQHENEQARIDREIEEEAKNSKKETKYEDTAEYGFEVFWNYVEN
jgi:hypothetical protein